MDKKAISSWNEIPGLTEESDIESIETGWFMYQDQPEELPFRGPGKVRVNVIVKLSPEGHKKFLAAKGKEDATNSEGQESNESDGRAVRSEESQDCILRDDQ